MDFILRIALLSIVFILLLLFRKRIARFLRRIPLSELLLYLLVSIPLIILEEQVNCEASWCGTVLIPPTLPFLFVELLVLYGLYRWLRIKNIWPLLLGYALFGIIWELSLGGLKGASVPGTFLAFMIFWVGVSYVFVAMTPLTLLSPKQK